MSDKQRDLEELVDEWLATKSLSPHTLRSYTNSMRRLSNWLAQSGETLGEMKTSSYENFLEWLSNTSYDGGRGLSHPSVVQIQRITGNFFQWAVEHGLLIRSPSWGIKLPSSPILNPQITALSNNKETTKLGGADGARVDDILGKPITNCQEKYQQSALICNLIVWTGLNLEEIAKARLVATLEHENTAEITLNLGNSNEEVTASVPLHVVTWLYKFYGLSPNRRLPEQGLPLIPPKRRTNVSSSTLYRILRNLSFRDGRSVSIRSLRAHVRKIANEQEIPPATIAYLQRVSNFLINAQRPRSIDTTIKILLCSFRN
ncbi:site-specific integrase [Undibacterium jejuense]|uniref:Site-specific integrase n=1 Tax=Undibacterium jejuense TaxID=1344949 RepID=A0A923HHV2_9BURK|nr:site-specific integrase [Undibacterium jejuense]MBC3862430.1 site-specific integrase [Undibacterium jejuense]